MVNGQRTRQEPLLIYWLPLSHCSGFLNSLTKWCSYGGNWFVVFVALSIICKGIW